MRRKTQAIIGTVLCTAMVVAGCTSKEEGSGSPSPSAGTAATGTPDPNKPVVENGIELTPAGTYPITKQKVTLRVFAPIDASIEDLNTNELTKEYEAKTNVHIEWMLVSDKDLEQKKNLLLASNSDMPDIFLNSKITTSQQAQFGAQGVLRPLNELIEQYGTNLKKLLDYDSLLRSMMTAPDGKIYALPASTETYHTVFGQKLWINQAWLTKLGLNTPTTTDEFFDVLKAFKERDPNGNGKPDEIPFTGATNGYMLNIFGYLMNAFIQNQGFDQKPFLLKDGKVSVSFDQPEWREGLRYLNKLYKAGLLDPGALTQDNNQLKQLAANKDSLLGAVSAGAMTGFLTNGVERMKDYTALAPLKGPAGVQSTGYYPYQEDLTKFAISSASKYPQIAMRWVDWFYSQAGTLRANAGREGIEWRLGKPDEVGMNGKPATYVRMLLFGKTQNVHWNQMTPLFMTRDFRNGVISDPTNQETILYNETKKKYEPFQPKEVLPPVFMTAEEAEEFNGIDASMKPYLVQAASKFVVGDLDLDKDWNSYLQQLDKIGLKRYIALTQSAYDRGYKKK
ncbi:MAG: ABC transporter substrate-binding protein [Paenibacillaceae bacterium]|nr:ABC transporter substrate-binding protein [Paenibacillaceae bacterium]